MVNLCVPGCTNSLAKTSKTADISYHKFPSDKQRRKTWLERIRRSNMPPMQYSYVSSNHFLPSCFEVNIRSQITGQKCKLILKKDAVPSEFDYGREAKKPRLSSENHLERRKHEEVSILNKLKYSIFFDFCRVNVSCVVQFNEDESSVLLRLFCFDFSLTSIVFLKKCGEKSSLGIIKQVNRLTNA